MTELEILHGDSACKLTSMDSNKTHLVVTSQPYDQLRKYNGNDVWDFENTARQLYRVLVDGGVLCWNGVSRSQLTVLTGYKRSSRDAYISRLKEKRLVEQNGETIIATLEGEEALPDAQPLPVGEELRNHWMQRLPEGERKIFEILVASYPEPVQRESIDEATGYKRSSRDAYLSRMSAKMIVTEPSRGFVRASDQLF